MVCRCYQRKKMHGVVMWIIWWCCVFILPWSTIEAQIRYTIPEELREGSVVGNIAKDLDLDVSTILDRKLQISTMTPRRDW
uniref:Cadherin N-terminal domain-containing protein n=1 Tax=Sinocyclocheilus rhinocerous TaxID=307959 RepID=A0A673FM93_9TELE